MSEKLTDFVRDIYDDYTAMKSLTRFRGRVKLTREQVEEKIIIIIKKLEK